VVVWSGGAVVVPESGGIVSGAPEQRASNTVVTRVATGLRSVTVTVTAGGGVGQLADVVYVAVNAGS